MAGLRQVDYLIVGGGIAGTTAAETIRERSAGRVMIVSDERHFLYSRVRLPDYVTGRIPREKVFIKEEGWYHERGIELLWETTVISILPKDQQILLSNGTVVHYQRLLLSTGGTLRRLKCEGCALEGIYYLRTIEDAEALREAIQRSKRAVVVGGGFIGLELARCFIHGGLETVMVMMEPRFWPLALDEESGKMIEAALQSQEIARHYSNQVSALKGNRSVQQVVLASGKSHECDMAGVGVGIEASHSFIRSSDIEVRRGVLTDEYLRTSDPQVFAAGDVAEFYDVSRSQHNQIGNWSNASEQGKVAALNMLDEKTVYKFVSNYVIRVFGLSIAFVGDTALLPGTQVIRRGSTHDGGYGRLLVRDGAIKGATLLNRPHEMRPIVELIKSGLNIDRFWSDLANVNFDLGCFAASA